MSEPLDDEHGPYSTWAIESCQPSWRDPAGAQLLSTTDAMVWAGEAMRLFPDGMPPDKALLLAWFANAIETGREAGRRPLTRLCEDVAHAHLAGSTTAMLRAAGLWAQAVMVEGEPSAELVLDVPGEFVPHVHLRVLPPRAPEPSDAQ